MLALHLPKDYRPGMGFYATESCLLESDPLPENRVGGFRTSPIIHAQRLPAQVVEPYQEAMTFDSSTVSGVGEWLSNDPIGISGGLNQYVFCGNNPVNFRDPMGLCEEPSAWENYQHSMDGVWDRLGEPIHNFRNNTFSMWEDFREWIGLPISPPDIPTTIGQNDRRDADYFFEVIGAFGGGKNAPKGWQPVKGAPFNSHGQPVFKKGNRYLTPDADGHKGGVWKQFDLKGRRLGTYDANGNQIGR